MKPQCTVAICQTFTVLQKTYSLKLSMLVVFLQLSLIVTYLLYRDRVYKHKLMSQRNTLCPGTAICRLSEYTYVLCHCTKCAVNY